ncbi:ParB N-terminal domain-containing protein [Mucilaginibacter gynuensis]|uniref:ParB N-terminal domain-containing protein n=1 Tax=Mucilaginibacter gynuensis TaxID=1302236 RepID=UPI003CD0B15E
MIDIPVKDIFANPNNPRLIFDPKDLDDLKESIQSAVVNVPVTVYQDDSVGPRKYILLEPIFFQNP